LSNVFLPVKCYVLGSTLIEVLVALVVLGIGVVGFLAMQLQSVTVVNDAYYRTQAIVIAQDVIERIKANSRGWPDHYAMQEWQGNDVVVMQPCAVSVVPDDLASACDRADEIAEFDHFEVSQQLRVSLPNAKVHIYASCFGGGGVSCVDVLWGGKDISGACSDAQVDTVMDHQCISVNFIAYRQR